MHKIYKHNYCCTSFPKTIGTKYKTELGKCVNLNTNLNLTKKKNSNTNTNKFAIFTLIYENENLPSIMMLGSSIRKFMPPHYKKYITLCCMVTHNIVNDTRDTISKLYDKIIEVDYLNIPSEKLLNTTDSKIFTKLRIFEFSDYDKILFLTSTILILKKDIFSLFNLNTPAAIFLGKLSNNSKDTYTKSHIFKKYQDKYCNWKGKQLHGNLIPYTLKNNNNSITNGSNIDTTILLIKPSNTIIIQRDNYIKNMINKKYKISSVTEMISHMFKNKIYAIEPRFNGARILPRDFPNLVVFTYTIDWDSNKLLNYRSWVEIEYLFYYYIDLYEKNMKKYNNTLLDTLYNKLIVIMSQHYYQHKNDVLVTKENYAYVRDYKKQLVQNVTNLLNDLSIKFVIGHGSLLEYEQGKPIYHDDDVDIRFNIKDFNKWEQFCKDKNNKEHNNYNLLFDEYFINMKNQLNNGIQVRLIKYNNIKKTQIYSNIDIHIDLVNSKAKTWIDYDINFNNLRKIKFLDVDTYAPSVSDTKKVLYIDYGKNYMIPNYKYYNIF